MTNIYEELIIKHIVEGLSLDLTSLRWFPVVPLLPDSDCDLFQLFDIVPTNGIIANVDKQSSLLSATYGKLLDAQQQSFINDMAKKNYANEAYWLTCNSSNTPIFRPNSAAIVSALASGPSFDFSFDSSNYPTQKIALFPSFPNLVIYQPFLNFNDTAMGERFVFKLHFDHVVNIPIQFAGWFTQGAFVKAYQDQSGWVTGSGLVTWDDLFGTNGILNFITNGLLVASGMTLEIESFAKYDLKTLLFLKTNLLTTVWPFYLSPENTTNEFDICDDGSIKIKVTTSNSKSLLLAMQASAINNLVPPIG